MGGEKGKGGVRMGMVVGVVVMEVWGCGVVGGGVVGCGGFVEGVGVVEGGGGVVGVGGVVGGGGEVWVEMEGREEEVEVVMGVRED